jgi:hypothetical protein
LENNNAFIKNGANTYYKISTILLQDSLNNVKSEEYYSKYKESTKLFDPTFDFKQQDIKYYNTTGSIFEDLYMRNNFNQKYGDVAKTALLKVLDIDSQNISANINLGNIAPSELIALETLRLGLRGDSFDFFLDKSLISK